MKKLTACLILLFSIGVLFADTGEPRIANGITYSAGNYEIYFLEEIYYFNGNEYEVYSVKYDSSNVDFKIAVYKKNFIAFNEDFTMFYKKDKNGFGIRKVWFTNPSAILKYDPRKYQRQTIIGSQFVDLHTALKLIAVYLPQIKI